ncbi:hypothetical protein PT974_06762 [Cladobotryum mycophilum]|uniref:Uncharacterized protein n=1 Tax=Cladobotryum mycophilum TaxID=491253 RepID=A0ABR0SMK5_9HYPO
MSPASGYSAEVVDTRPEVSVYSAPSIMLRLQDGSHLYVPTRLLQEIPKLAHISEQGDYHLDVLPDVGHVLAHYLFTKSYECLRPRGSTPHERLAREFTTSVRVYAAARTYELLDLEDLAKSEIDRLGDKLRTPLVFDLAQMACPNPSADDVWLTNYLKTRLRHLLENPREPLDWGSPIEDRTLSISDILFRSMLELVYGHKISPRRRSNESSNETFNQVPEGPSSIRREPEVERRSYEKERMREEKERIREEKERVREEPDPTPSPVRESRIDKGKEPAIPTPESESYDESGQTTGGDGDDKTDSSQLSTRRDKKRRKRGGRKPEPTDPPPPIPEPYRSELQRQEQHRPDQHRPEQHRPEQHRPEQHRPEQHRPEQQRQEQHRPEQHNPDQHRPDQYRPDQHRPEPHKPEPHKPEPTKTAAKVAFAPEPSVEERKNNEHKKEEGDPGWKFWSRGRKANVDSDPAAQSHGSHKPAEAESREPRAEQSQRGAEWDNRPSRNGGEPAVATGSQPAPPPEARTSSKRRGRSWRDWEREREREEQRRTWRGRERDQAESMGKRNNFGGRHR